jgi:hypothetical protein
LIYRGSKDQVFVVNRVETQPWARKIPQRG